MVYHMCNHFHHDEIIIRTSQENFFKIFSFPKIQSKHFNSCPQTREKFHEKVQIPYYTVSFNDPPILPYQIEDSIILQKVKILRTKLSSMQRYLKKEKTRSSLCAASARRPASRWCRRRVRSVSLRSRRKVAPRTAGTQTTIRGFPTVGSRVFWERRCPSSWPWSPSSTQPACSSLIAARRPTLSTSRSPLNCAT